MEKNQTPKKASDIENRAGDVYGNGAEPLALPSTASQTDGESTVNTTDETSPRKPPITAPRVGQSFHNTLMNSTGKFAEAATAKARETMKATFCFSNTMPSSTATTPNATVVMRETRNSSLLSAWPFLISVAYRSCDTADAPESVKPATTARMVAKATAEMKPMNTLPPMAEAMCTAVMLPPPLSAPLASRNCGSALTKIMAPKPMMKVRI